MNLADQPIPIESITETFDSEASASDRISELSAADWHVHDMWKLEGVIIVTFKRPAYKIGYPPSPGNY